MVRRDAGFTYIGLIVLVTIIGLVGAATLKVDALLRRAAAEQELLETGAAFGAALKSYADATPRGQPTYPPSLQELLKDPRFPGIRRHLRKIFPDPVTGRAEWGIVYAAGQSGVLAVYSLSQAQPLKLANFDARFQNFENREHISDWKFAATGQALSVPGQGQLLAGAPSVPAAAAASPAPASEQRSLFAPAEPPAPPSVPADTAADSAAEPPAAAPPPSEDSGSGDEKDEKDRDEKAAPNKETARDRQETPAEAENR
jgi:type II secretory pathway pseudopilin PulG